MTTINITRGTANPHFELPEDRQVGDDFTFQRQHLLVVTDEQGESFRRVLDHQGYNNYRGAYYNHLDNYLAVEFNGIFIGIETDGYAHS